MDVNVLETYKSIRGTVWIIENESDSTREDLSKFWNGQVVNGRRVIGVESHALHIIRKGSHIGLLIEKV